MKERGSKKLVLATLLVVSIAVVANAQRRPKDKILDRKVFVVTMQMKSEKKRKKSPEPFETELSFRSNRVVARHMQKPDAGGFQAGEYAIYEKETVLDENKYKFEGINKNSKGMSLKWNGTIYGGQIEGTAVVSKKGKVKQEFDFEGALKQKKKRK